MEIALDDPLPTFSGGLGVLAGDHLRAAADRGIPIAGVTLLYGHGFFRQSVADGAQHEEPVQWTPASELEPLDLRVVVVVSGRRVLVRVWKWVVQGVGAHQVPVYFLDTDVEENASEDRAITDRLYTNDPYARLRQEAVLGLAGPLVLESLGYLGIRVHHLNEGHGALVPVGLLARRLAAADPGGRVADVVGLALDAGAEEVEAVRRRCAFTTHTPVPAGHDRFPPEVAEAVLGRPLMDTLASVGCLEPDGTLNMTLLGMRCSGKVNAVSLRHRDVTRAMFPFASVDAITNGVHTATWAAPATAALFDEALPGWRNDSQQLRYAQNIEIGQLQAVHDTNKAALCDVVRRRAKVALRPDVLTIGIARRFAAYKRNDLVLSDLERLRAIATRGPLQIVFSGKAHPEDGDGKAMIGHVLEVAAASAATPGDVTVVFLEDYGMGLGRLLCSGSDVWLNTPSPPNEASGTSAMKAALNGVPSLSTLDGWWIEGCVEGVTGWAIGSAGEKGASSLGAQSSDGSATSDPSQDADRLYEVLGEHVVPAYYKDPAGLVWMGRNAISLNGSFFSAHRMVDEYVRRVYPMALS